MKTEIKPVAAAIALALTASPAYALTSYYVAAKAYDKLMPDGSTVPMWGYVIDADNNANNVGDCWQAGNARQACIDALPTPSGEALQLTMPPGDNLLRILLSNGLPEPTSVIIPGQELPSVNVIGVGTVPGPTWDDGTTGDRGNTGQRVRSFVAEASENGGRAVYRWFAANPIMGSGTLLFHSATHPQKQVYMGLAGLVTQDAAVGEAYPGVPYSSEVTLFYSDIDPAFNAAVVDVDGTAGDGPLTTAMDRHPTWFLVNGEPYDAGVTPPIGAGNAGDNTLLRLASTATDTHVAVIQGMNMAIHAEDGQQYNYQEGTIVTPAPRVQYSAMLPPTKTKDAIVVAPLAGEYAVYDGNGYMTNPSDPADEPNGDEAGGMLRFLAFGVGVNQAPTANPDAASVVEGFSIGINVLGNDTDPEGDALSINSFDAAIGLSCSLSPGGTCTYDATGVAPGDVTFNYVATDGTSLSNPATVTITVDPNLAPTANDDAATTDTGVPVVIDVAGNDTDPEGQPLSVATFDPSSTGGQAVACAGTDCTYSPVGYSGVDTFTYTISDGVNTSAAATVTVTVVAANVPPVANDDTGETGINVQLTGIDVLGNDTDADGPSPLTIQSYDATGTAGGTVACVTGVDTGTCTFTPATDYDGDDTFEYTVTDGADTDVATVTITVNPAAAPALYFSTSGNGSVPGPAGPFDNADVYTVDAGGVYSRLYDAVSDLGLPNGANIDGMSVNGTDVYVSFASSSTNVPGIGNVNDEDVVVYDTVGGTWSTFFDGTECNLNGGSGDIDAVSVLGMAPSRTLYFSTLGNVNVQGTPGADDDADVYTWAEGATSCGRALDGSANGLGGEDIDALTVQGGDYYISSNSTFNPPGPVGTVGDEAVLLYSGGSWSLFRDNSPGLSGSGSQDVDAIHVP